MKLFHNPASPFVRKVVVLLHELKCPNLVEYEYAIGTPVEPGSLPITENPLGKIPTLTGTPYGRLYDSRTICRYLNEYVSGELYPEPPDLWTQLTLEASADGIMDAAVSMVYEFRCRPEEHRSLEWVESQWKKIARTLESIEQYWVPKEGDSVRIGHIALACALGYLDFRHADRPWRERHGTLEDWFAGFSQRDSMKCSLPE